MDLSSMVSRRDLARRLGFSKAHLAYLERTGKLKAERVIVEGMTRIFYTREEAARAQIELGLIPRSAGRKRGTKLGKPREKERGVLAARVMRMLEEGKTLTEIVIECEAHPDFVRKMDGERRAGLGRLTPEQVQRSEERLALALSKERQKRNWQEFKIRMAETREGSVFQKRTKTAGTTGESR